MQKTLFVRYAGKVTGPFSRTEIESVAKAGKLGRLHEISDDKVTWQNSHDWLNQIGSQSKCDVPVSPQNRAKQASSTGGQVSIVQEMPTQSVKSPKQSPAGVSVEESAVPSATLEMLAEKENARTGSLQSPKPRRRITKAQSRLFLACLSVVFATAIIVPGIIFYQQNQKSAQLRNDTNFVLNSIEQARSLIEAENYVGAKSLLEQASGIVERRPQLADEAKTINDLKNSPAIRLGATGFKRVNDQWLPAAKVDAWMEARKSDDPLIDRFESEARQALADTRFLEAKQLVGEAIRRIDSEPLQLHPKIPALNELKLEIENALVAKEMIAKGLVLYSNKWVTPEEKFRLEQIAKGLVEYQGQWMTADAAFTAQQKAKGLVFFKDKWMTPEEKLQAQGFVQFEGNWITTAARDNIVSQRAAVVRQQQSDAAAAQARQAAAKAAAAAEQTRLAGLKQAAYEMSQEFVKDLLKSPATAQFQAYGSRQVTVTITNDGWFIVKGVVDAQNGFGALIRNTYFCKLKPIAGDKWQAEDTLFDK